ncbi:uncharacterized protein HaLaN_06507 [Haematococcus lacustris]|uniref:Magnesium and cobalt transport protein CorA n=1 Tax=Haematococcus lacustris TaxID=44745 RepID=A0A699Z6H2_HAELA|nr:uncharacterized protein HaLaN_06507 [Haematococcus lacustris]
MAPTLRLVTTLRINAKGAATADAISGARSGAASAHRRTTSDAAVQQSAAVHMQKQLHQAVQQKLVSASKQKAVPLISHLTSTYLGDVQDHLSILIDALDSQSDQCRDLINLVFNLIAHGTNQSMQTLTVVSVLFLPLTFLAGIYGMNFDMPELHWTYGYEYFYGVCGVVLLVFLACIRRVMGGAMGVF